MWINSFSGMDNEEFDRVAIARQVAAGEILLTEEQLKAFREFSRLAADTFCEL
jgi:hypothetical protein